MTWENDAKKLIEMLKPLDDTGPVHPTFATELGVVCAGISKRELFAGFAMLGLLANSRDGDIVKASVRFADALMAELRCGTGVSFQSHPENKSLNQLRAECTHGEWTSKNMEPGNAYCLKCSMVADVRLFPRTENCTHYQWTDMENGIGQCRKCMAMLPYAAFGCAPDEA